MKIRQRFVVSALITLTLIGCTKNECRIPYPADSFNNYWYTGKAEVASYSLRQSRYGEIHEGKTVLIFVTEPFSASKQVKLDHPETAGDDKVTVMKLNFIKKFNTGIYPYSMMLSAFTPVAQQSYPHSLKVSMSAQEWCGHVYSQMNLDNNHYQVQSFSYFEKEGDQHHKVEAVLLEDEIWNRIRLNYKSLPTGRIEIIPGLFYLRLNHKDLGILTATASLQENNEVATYKITYLHRILSITFSKVFPYQIISWQETYKGIGGKVLTTTATLDKALHIDYWTKNNKADSHWRDSLFSNLRAKPTPGRKREAGRPELEN